MNRISASLGAVAALLALTGCATPSTPVPADAPVIVQTAAPEEALSEQDRISFFVHDARSGHCDKLEAAIQDGMKVDAVDAVDQTALIAAAGKNHLDCVRLLLAHGANPDHRDPGGWTALFHATYFGADAGLIATLVKAGADVNAQNDRGATALYLAAAGGHEAYVRLLLALGADPALATRAGYTPLRVAQINGLTQIVALLDGNKPAAASSSQ